jgi:phosphate starvation-inducible PhoH-like protein
MVAHNYKLQGKKVLLIKPFIDDRFGDKIKSRCGLESDVEYLLKKEDSDLSELNKHILNDLDAILVDEAQNLTKTELKMLLSRIGKNCKIVLSGDPKQVDISDSGLGDAVKRLENLPGIEIVRFLDEDIVRSAMCKQVILA